MLQRLLQPLHDRVHDATVDRLRRLESDLVSPRVRFAVPYVFEGAGVFRSIRPQLRGDEAEPLYNEAIALQPRRVLQIGTRSGGCTYWWAQAATPDAVIVSVSLPLPGRPVDAPCPMSRIADGFRQAGQRLAFLSAAATLSQVRDALDRQPVDLLFLDGDPDAAAVARDFNQFAPLVRPDGLIAMHHIAGDPDRAAVARLWPQLRDRYDTREYIADGSNQGIGVVCVPDRGVEPIDLTDG